MRGDPDGGADQAADAGQPGEQALRHGTEAAEGEAGVLRRVLDAVEVRDHVALLVGGEVAVAEVGHVLRPGQQRLVDVLALDAVERRGVAAARHRAAGTVEVVARRAVGEEDLAAPGDGLLALLLRQALDRVVGRVGDGGAGAQRGDVRRQGSGLLVVEDDLLAGCLRAGARHRHAAGADLEVDRGGTDTDQRRTDLVAVADRRDALAVLAVAERAAGEEELLALGDLLGLAGLVLGLGRGEGGVEGAADQQPEQQHRETSKWSPAMPGEATSGSVEHAHCESLPVSTGVGWWVVLT